MVDYVQTCTNSVYLYGAAATVQWGNFNWGEEAWGTIAENLVIQVYKGLSPVINLSEVSYSRDIVHPFDNTITLADAYPKAFTLDTITETLSINADTSSEVLFEEDWEYVFTGPTTNAETRSNTNWSTT